MHRMLTGLRIFTIVLMTAGIIFALLLLTGLVFLLHYSISMVDGMLILMSILEIVVTITASNFCWRALQSFYTMCRRLQNQSAFTGDNCEALAFIARQCALAGTVLLGGFAALFLYFFFLDAWQEIISILLRTAFLPLLLLAAALMIRAVHLLMRRALALQTESDLTI